MIARIAALAMCALISCGRSVAPDGADDYKPAREDYGRVRGVWIYTAGTQVKAAPGTQLIAADLHFPPATEGKFDLDDIDLFDAEDGTNFGSDPYIQRLTPEGEMVDDDDPVVADDRDYRGIFVWQVPRAVTRVNFGYWGEMLYKNPVTVDADVRVLPEIQVDAVGAERGGAATDAYESRLVMLHVRDSFRTFTPRNYTLFASGAPEEKSLCDINTWVELDGDGRVVTETLQDRAYLLPDRWFLVDYWCANGIQPDTLNIFGQQTPLHVDRPLRASIEARRALTEATPKEHALHRLK
ncbi:MAG TPA: hypothetical protein VF701_08565 [Thermoanaerobaculia bacterium]